MPIDSSIRKVMVIGSGPIVIGQAAEFDYAGAQACRVLHDAGVNVADGALDGPTAKVEAAVAQIFPARHRAAQPGHRETAFPAVFDLCRERCQQRVDQHRAGHRFGVRIAGVAVDPENHDAQIDADLRRGQAGTVERAHGVLHIDDQRREFVGGEALNDPRLLPQTRIAHFQHRSNHRRRASSR